LYSIAQGKPPVHKGDMPGRMTALYPPGQLSSFGFLLVLFGTCSVITEAVSKKTRTRPEEASVRTGKNQVQ
jgi:hypothetical protein